MMMQVNLCNQVETCMYSTLGVERKVIGSSMMMDRAAATSALSSDQIRWICITLA